MPRIDLRNVKMPIRQPMLIKQTGKIFFSGNGQVLIIMSEKIYFFELRKMCTRNIY